MEQKPKEVKMRRILPEFIYEDPPQSMVEQEITGAQHFTPQEVIIDPVEGVRVKIEGAEFLSRFFTETEVMFSLNILKKTLIEFIKLFYLPQFWLCIPAVLIFPKRKLISSLVEKFNRIAEGVLKTYTFKPEYMSPAGREIRFIILDMLSGIGVSGAETFARYVSHIPEFDWSYMERIIDLASETDKNRLANRPIREIIRLGKIASKRERDRTVRKKIRMIFILAAVFMITPSVRRSFVRTIKASEWEKLQYTDEALYWCTQRSGYLFMGKTDDEKELFMKERGWKKIDTKTTSEVISYQQAKNNK